MADIENTELENTEETVEVKDTEDTKGVVEDTTHKSELDDEGRKSTLARIADILRGKKSSAKEEVVDDTAVAEEKTEVSEDKSEAEAVEDTETKEEDTHTDEYEEIDPRFVEAARKYGWSDDRIVEYAEKHDDRDTVMLTAMMEREVPSKPEDETKQSKEESPAAKRILDQLEASEDIGEPVKLLLKSLVTDLENTKAQLKAVTATQKDVDKSAKQQEWIGRAREADEQFDAAAKEFTELGSFKNLKRLPDGSLNPNDATVKVREDLFKMAVTLFNSGESWNQAVKDSLRWYKGGREDVVETKVLQKIKDNAKRLSPKRETRHQVRKYANEIEEKAAVVNEALRKHGVELPE